MLALAMFVVVVGAVLIGALNDEDASGAGPALAVLGGIGLAAILIYVLATDALTLYPLGTNGEPDTSAKGVEAEPAAAVYVAGVACACTTVGGLVMSEELV